MTRSGNTDIYTILLRADTVGNKTKNGREGTGRGRYRNSFPVSFTHWTPFPRRLRVQNISRGVGYHEVDRGFSLTPCSFGMRGWTYMYIYIYISIHARTIAKTIRARDRWSTSGISCNTRRRDIGKRRGGGKRNNVSCRIVRNTRGVRVIVYNTK